MSASAVLCLWPQHCTAIFGSGDATAACIERLRFLEVRFHEIPVQQVGLTLEEKLDPAKEAMQETADWLRRCARV